MKDKTPRTLVRELCQADRELNKIRVKWLHKHLYRESGHEALATVVDQKYAQVADLRARIKHAH